MELGSVYMCERLQELRRAIDEFALNQSNLALTLTPRDWEMMEELINGYYFK